MENLIIELTGGATWQEVLDSENKEEPKLMSADPVELPEENDEELPEEDNLPDQPELTEETEEAEEDNKFPEAVDPVQNKPKYPFN